MKSLIFGITLMSLTPALIAGAEESGFSDIRNPRIPSTVEFAVKKIDMSRTDMYERLDRELTAMAYTHGNTLLQIKRANRYFPVMEPILKKNGVPADLLYLACIESTLNPRAVSPAKAAGLWQFMPSTAKEYGLEVNEYVDERFDPVKSTEAACRYLKKAYDRYGGNWENAAASYNAGMGRVSSELTNQQVQSAYDLWLADETMRYIYRLIAAKLLMEHAPEFGFTLSADQLYQPYEYRTVNVSGAVDDWAKWATENGTTYYLLREHNPWIRSRSLPNKQGKTYTINIPTDNSLDRRLIKTHVHNRNWISR